MSQAVFLELMFHVANAIALAAYLFRDQFYLRLTVVISMILQAIYYLFISSTGPLFDPLVWKVLTIVLNAGMIALLFRDRLSFGIDAETRPLYEAIGVLTPGQFRRLLRAATRVSGPLLMVRLGLRPEALFYVLVGHAEVRKDGRRLDVGPGSFIGEIAFLTGSGATADVSLHAESRALSWDVVALRTLMQKEKAIDIALRGLLSHDLALKTSRSDLPEALGAPSEAALANP